MFYKKLTTGIILTVMLLLSACAVPNGSIVILENPNGSSFTIDFAMVNAKNKCELSLAGGDVLQVEVEHESGEIALTVSGKNGSEPYTGNDLVTGIFTITVFETDEYVFRITGKDATGKITVKNLGSEVK
jgi:hypothetical protein